MHLDEYRAGLLPEGKAAELESLGPRQSVLFVGDGINDAPVPVSYTHLDVYKRQVWWYACAYGLGDGDPEGYDYIFGLPAWFFLSCIAGYPLLSALLWFMVRRFFKDIPLDEEGGAPKREGLEVTDERHPEAF